MLRIALVVVCLLATACSGKKTSSQKSDPDANQPAAALFTVSDNQLERLKIVPARTATFPISVQTTGTVDWDADHTAPAIAQVGGPVTRIVVDTGSRVKAGDPLLYVSSTDASNAIVAYRKAKNDEDLARRNMERAKDLLDHGAIARQDFEAAQSAFNDAAADVQNSLQSLRIYGLSQSAIDEAQQQGVPVRPEIAQQQHGVGRRSPLWRVKAAVPGLPSRPRAGRILPGEQARSPAVARDLSALSLDRLFCSSGEVA